MYLYQLAPAANAPFLAASPWKGEAGVFDLTTGRLLSRFATNEYSIGHLLTLSRDGSVVVAAAWERHGVSAHAARTGELLWRRKDLRNAATPRVAMDGRRLFVRSSRFQVLDLPTGEEIARWRGVQEIHESADGEQTLVEGSDYRPEDREGALVATIPRLTFALLDCAFTPEVVAITESGGPVRAVSRQDGRERWRITPVAGTHVLRLAYQSASDDLIALEWPYETGGEAHVLVLDPSSGVVRHTWPGVHVGAQFCLGGSALAYPDGTVHDALTGEQILALEPVPDWPDLPTA